MLQEQPVEDLLEWIIAYPAKCAQRLGAVAAGRRVSG